MFPILSNRDFPRELRCLIYLEVQPGAVRDCIACRTIQWCRYYDRSYKYHEIDRWEDDGGASV